MSEIHARPPANGRRYDVIIVGAGHNGLVTAFYLSRAGLRVLVVEALETVGGACKTEELVPGYRFSTCANWAGWWRRTILDDMVSSIRTQSGRRRPPDADFPT